jgi:hypothetical protein
MIHFANEHFSNGLKKRAISVLSLCAAFLFITLLASAAPKPTLLTGHYVTKCNGYYQKTTPVEIVASAQLGPIHKGEIHGKGKLSMKKGGNTINAAHFDSVTTGLGSDPPFLSTWSSSSNPPEFPELHFKVYPTNGGSGANLTSTDADWALTCKSKIGS